MTDDELDAYCSHSSWQMGTEWKAEMTRPYEICNGCGKVRATGEWTWSYHVSQRGPFVYHPRLSDPQCAKRDAIWYNYIVLPVGCGSNDHRSRLPTHSMTDSR